MTIVVADTGDIEAIKEQIKKDYRAELEQIRNYRFGCSEKCTLERKVLQEDLDINRKLVRKLREFKW